MMWKPSYHIHESQKELDPSFRTAKNKWESLDMDWGVAYLWELLNCVILVSWCCGETLWFTSGKRRKEQGQMHTDEGSWHQGCCEWSYVTTRFYTFLEFPLFWFCTKCARYEVQSCLLALLLVHCMVSSWKLESRNSSCITTISSASNCVNLARALCTVSHLWCWHSDWNYIHLWVLGMVFGTTSQT